MDELSGRVKRAADLSSLNPFFSYDYSLLSRPRCNYIRCRRPPLRAQIPQYDHVVVVIFENHSYSEIIGNPAAPTFNSLAANAANIVPAANDPTGSRSGSHGLQYAGSLGFPLP